MQIKYFATFFGLIMTETIVQARLQCTEQSVTTQKKLPADFLFLIDTSASMKDKIAGLTSGLNKFIEKMKLSGIDAQYGLVSFGGQSDSKAVLRMPFTRTPADINTAMTRLVKYVGEGGQEASLEALRLVVQRPDLLVSGDYCFKSNCKLTWRTGVAKVIIHATDEDSDLPTLTEFRMPGQNRSISFCATRWVDSKGSNCVRGAFRFEPSFQPYVMRSSDSLFNAFRSGRDLKLTGPYQAEIDLTSDVLFSNSVILSSLVAKTPEDVVGWTDRPISTWNSKNSYYVSAKNAAPPSNARDSLDYGVHPFTPDSVHTSMAQFGHPDAAAQNADFSGFNAGQTIAGLEAFGLQKSLQYQMLKRGGFMRLFDIGSFSTSTSQTTIVNNFYTFLVQDVVQKTETCIEVPDVPNPPVSYSTSSSAKAVTSSSATSQTSATNSVSSSSKTSTTVTSLSSSSTSRSSEGHSGSTSSMARTSDSSTVPTGTVSSGGSQSKQTPTPISTSQESSSAAAPSSTSVSGPGPAPTDDGGGFVDETATPPIDLTKDAEPGSELAAPPKDDDDDDISPPSPPTPGQSETTPVLEQPQGIVTAGPLEGSKGSAGPTPSPTNAFVFGIGVPVALGAAAIGLLMLRKGRLIAKDIKFAFGPAEQVGGNNPLYESISRSSENPLYVEEHGSTDLLAVKNIEDAI